jgi:predicted nucleic-acid-binding Zn-ribbon protein
MTDAKDFTESKDFFDAVINIENNNTLTISLEHNEYHEFYPAYIITREGRTNIPRSIMPSWSHDFNQYLLNEILQRNIGHLTSLTLKYCNSKKYGYTSKLIELLEALPNLNYLKLDECDIKGELSRNIATCLSQNTNIKVIDFGSSTRIDSSFIYFLNNRNIIGIEGLPLSSQDIIDELVEKINDNHFPNITTLFTSSCLNEKVDINGLANTIKDGKLPLLRSIGHCFGCDEYDFNPENYPLDNDIFQRLNNAFDYFENSQKLDIISKARYLKEYADKVYNNRCSQPVIQTGHKDCRSRRSRQRRAYIKKVKALTPTVDVPSISLYSNKIYWWTSIEEKEEIKKKEEIRTDTLNYILNDIKDDVYRALSEYLV